MRRTIRKYPNQPNSIRTTKCFKELFRLDKVCHAEASLSLSSRSRSRSRGRVLSFIIIIESVIRICYARCVDLGAIGADSHTPTKLVFFLFARSLLESKHQLVLPLPARVEASASKHQLVLAYLIFSTSPPNARGCGRWDISTRQHRRSIIVRGVAFGTFASAHVFSSHLIIVDYKFKDKYI